MNIKWQQVRNTQVQCVSLKLAIMCFANEGIPDVFHILSYNSKTLKWNKILQNPSFVLLVQYMLMFVFGCLTS